MKLAPVEIERSLQSPVENEVQRQLRAILEYWGPNGERHWRAGGGERDPDIAGARLCAVLAYCRLHPHEVVFSHTAARSFLFRAAREFGFRGIPECSDSSFANAKKMVERAIELAGQP